MDLPQKLEPNSAPSTLSVIGEGKSLRAYPQQITKTWRHLSIILFKKLKGVETPFYRLCNGARTSETQDHLPFATESQEY